MIGDRAVQSNYFITDMRAEGCLAVLSDGTIDSVNGMRAAVFCCDTVKKHYSGGWFTKDLFLRCQRKISDGIYRGRTPRVSLTAIWMTEKQVFYRQTGSQKLFLFRGGTMVLLPEEEGVVGLEPGNSVLLCSQGFWTTLNEVEIGAVMGKGSLSAYEKAQEMLKHVRRKNKREQENATIVILEHG